MKGRFSAGLFGLAGTVLILGGLMAACAPDTSAPTLAPRTEPVQTEEPTAVSMEILPANVLLEPFTDQECLDCHTDQSLLTELALPDEVVESLSEGPG
jgi:hypothetical protein